MEGSTSDSDCIAARDVAPGILAGRLSSPLERRRENEGACLSFTALLETAPLAAAEARGGGRGGADPFCDALPSKKSLAARTETGFAGVLGGSGGGVEGFGAVTSRSSSALGSGRVLNWKEPEVRGRLSEVAPIWEGAPPVAFGLL